MRFMPMCTAAKLSMLSRQLGTAHLRASSKTWITWSKTSTEWQRFSSIPHSSQLVGPRIPQLSTTSTKSTSARQRSKRLCRAGSTRTCSNSETHEQSTICFTFHGRNGVYAQWITSAASSYLSMTLTMNMILLARLARSIAQLCSRNS